MSNIFISIWLPILFGLVFFSSFVHGIDLLPRIKNDVMYLSVNNIQYPQNIIEQDINSGLPNNINLIISLTRNGQQRFLTSVNYQITYDLWDEIYNVTINHADGVQKISFENSTLLVDFINNLTFTSGNILKEIDSTEVHQLKAMVLVNPVKTERIKKIRAWIATSQGYTYEQNSDEQVLIANARPAPVTSSIKVPVIPREQVSGKLGTIAHQRRVDISDSAVARPRFQKLFDQILDQYMDPDEIPALWRSEQVSLDITQQSLINEK